MSNERIVNVTQVHENNQSILNIKNVYRTEICPIKLNEKFICRAYYSLTSSFQNMCVNHSCVDVLMPQQLLHSSNAIAIFQQVCSKGMSKCVTGSFLTNFRISNCNLHRPMYAALIGMVSLLLPRIGTFGSLR